MKKPLFVATSDEHLTNQTPVNRTDDYLEACCEKLKFVTAKANELGVPWLSGGDLFDKAMPQPEVITAAIKHIKPTKGFYSIPGNHDIKNHNYDLIQKSATYTLKTMGKNILRPYEVIELDDIIVVGFPYGFYDASQVDFSGVSQTKPRVALIHVLTYPKANVPFIGCKAADAESLSKQLEMFDMVISGDNHKRFQIDNGRTLWVNCGSLMRRNVGQKEYQPQLHVVYDDFTFDVIDIPIKEGVIDDTKKVENKERSAEIESFVSSLSGAVELDLSFTNNLKAYIDSNEIEEQISEEVWKATEEDE